MTEIDEDGRVQSTDPPLLPEVKPPKRSRVRSGGDEQGNLKNRVVVDLDKRTRAIGILLGYVTWRLDIKISEINVKKSILDNARFAKRTLSIEEFRQLRDELQKLINRSAERGHMVEDFPWLCDVLTDCQISLPTDGSIFGDRLGLFRETREDMGLLDSLDAGLRYQTDSGVHESIGGLWHLIRRSTGNTGTTEAAEQLNVSLLNIKPTEYYGGSDTEESRLVRTSISHFSLRAKSKTAEDLLRFRGKIIASDTVIYFIGNWKQGKIPRIITMIWRMPNSDQEHAKYAQGLIMTRNAHGMTIAEPVVAVWKPVVVAANDLDDTEQKVGTAKIFKDEIHREVHSVDERDGCHSEDIGRIGILTENQIEFKFQREKYYPIIVERIKRLKRMEDNLRSNGYISVD